MLAEIFLFFRKLNSSFFLLFPLENLDLLLRLNSLDVLTPDFCLGLLVRLTEELNVSDNVIISISLYLSILYSSF